MTRYLDENSGKQIVIETNKALLLKANQSEITSARSGEVDLATKIGKIDSSLSEKAKQSDLDNTNIIVETKASISYIDTKIGNMGNAKIFKGSCLFSELPVSGMLVDDYWYVSDQTTNYCYNGTVWVNIGNNFDLGDGTVTEEKLSFPVVVGIPSKNLFDKSKKTIGYVVNKDNGILEVANDYFTSDYIEVSTLLSYTISKVTFLCFYDVDKIFISGTGLDRANYTFTPPTNSIYVRLSELNIYVNTLQLEVGIAPTEYQSFGGKVNNDLIVNKSIDIDKLSFIVPGTNMFNKANISSGYVDGATGTLVANSSYFTSGYIPITTLNQYTISKVTFLCFYTTNLTFISGSASDRTNYTFTPPTNSVYVKFSELNDYIDTIQLESGSIATPYLSYGNKIDSDLIANKSVIDTTSFTTTQKIVKANGTIGVDCDYTNIKSALDDITDNCFAKRYKLLILNGDYDVSNDGFDFLGMKNYVDIVGQSRNGVRVIKRENDLTVNAVKSTFDPVYYNQHIDYSSLRNMTIISHMSKCPVHIDNTLINTIEIIDCNLINENTPSDVGGNYQNGLACGLREGQHVIARGCYSNGMLWAHNLNTHYYGEGCSFELYNCISKYITVGDLLSYGHDTFIAEGCKSEYLKYMYYKNYGGQLSYIQPSWEFQLRGNSIDYITATTTVDGGISSIESAYDELYNGKCAITEPSINNYCKNTSVATITKSSLVTLDVDTDMTGVKAWISGSKLYGIALDTINTNDFGIVQYNGIISMSASGTTPIAFNDSVELNSSGIVIKHTSGDIIGYARESLASGTSIIKVKLVTQ